MKECSTRQNILKNQFHIDLEKLKHARSYIQCFALYSDLKDCEAKGLDPWTYILELYALVRDEIETTGGLLEVVKSVKEAEEVHAKGHLAALLTIEDGGIVYEDMNRLDTLYKMGIRMLSLTWDYSNSLGHPNMPETSHMGLTAFGHDVVERMNELGMIIDVSHLSDKGFWEIIEKSKSPVVASHSNARAVMAHRRNLDDKMIRALGNQGGVMGLNFCPYFVADKEDQLYVNDLAKHVLHSINKGGIDCVAIGTDFDGMNGNLEIRHIGEMDKLYLGLQRAGLTTDQVDKIFYKNAKRVFEDVIG
tara:strand:- start:48 stop:962 length:915 start_codon:yes stop_codon:yes gene_type:complete